MPVKTLKPVVAAKHRVFLVEDHPVTRDGLAQLINYQDDLEVCGAVGTIAKAVESIEASLPGLVLVDVSLPDGHGIELVKDLHARYPALLIMVLSMHDETLYAERALRAGARGFIMKQESTEVVIAALRQVLAGGTYLSPKMQERVVRRFTDNSPAPFVSEVERLTDRELEVFEMMGRGHGTRQIAKQLRLSVSTVETYRAHLKEKLQLQSGTELLRRAVEWVNRQRI